MLMGVVLKAIDNLVPLAKPSSYAKRWWTTDLSRRRRAYTYWRETRRDHYDEEVKGLLI
jgi:2-hydroxychromene-2-carboxylate isomerase